MSLLDILKNIKALSQEKGVKGRKAFKIAKIPYCRPFISTELDMSTAKEHCVNGTQLHLRE